MTLPAPPPQIHIPGPRKMSHMLATVIMVAAILAASVCAAGSSPNAPPPQPANGRPPQQYHPRIIFNCDGNSVFTAANGDLNRWIANVFTGLEHGQVDALFWCDGAGGNTANYDSKVLELTGQRIGKVPPALVQWIPEDNDPPKVVIAEARKRGLLVFYSFRINDIHDSFLPEEFPTFKEQHPEWMIGAGRPYGYNTALNFALPEVRALKFATIEEIVRNYDFDGLEIDFMRSPPFFLPGEEPAHADVLTQFLRDVRVLLDAQGRARGRRLELAVRVDDTLEACRLDGFDVPAWVAEGVLDLITLGSGVLDIEVEEFRRLVEGANITIYPCLYGWPSSYMPVSPELARGLALNYWLQGADGIYTFNWFPHEPDKAYQVGLLNEIGSPETLHGKDMMFAAERGRPLREYPHNWMHAVLPATVAAGQEVPVPIMVGEDFTEYPPSSLELVLTCDGLEQADPLQLSLNDQALSLGSRDDAHVRAPLAPGQVLQGCNQVTIGLSSGEATITAVEIHARYSR